MKKLIQFSLVSLPLLMSFSVAHAAQLSLVARTQGQILLQVQSHGEAWYVNPKDQKRYYMKDGAAAYQMMRSFGQGISETDFAKASTGNIGLLSRLKGLIILRVNLHGEAYYINPKTLALTYLKDGAAAYALMRQQGQGIASADLEKIGTGLVPSTVGTQVVTQNTATDTSLPPTQATQPSPQVQTPPATQTIPGMTGLIVQATPGGSMLNVVVAYSGASGIITDSGAYAIPVTGHISVYLEGFNHTAGQVLKGQHIVDRDLTANDIGRDSSGLPIIKISRDELMKNNAGGDHYGIVQVTITTPSQGNFMQTEDDVLLPITDQMNNTASFDVRTQLNSSVFQIGSNELGSNDYRTADFFLEQGALNILANNFADRNFVIWLENQNGIKESLLINEIGSGGFQDAENITQRGWYHLEVQSNGSWEVDVKQKIQ